MEVNSSRSEPQQATTQEFVQKEISLLDFLLVLIRFRVMILILTGLSLLVALAVYVVPGAIPFLQLTRTEYRARMEYTLVPLAQPLRVYANYDIPGILRSNLVDPAVITPLYVQHIRRDLENTPQIQGFVQSQFIGSSFSVSQPSTTLTLTITSHTSQGLVEFLQALNAHVDRNLRPQVQSLLSETTENMVIAFGDDRGSADQIFTARQLATLVRNDLFPWQASEPVLSVQHLRPGRTLPVLIVIGGVFLSILVAMLLEYLRTIKNDPEQMAKLRAALKKT